MPVLIPGSGRYPTHSVVLTNAHYYTYTTLEFARVVADLFVFLSDPRVRALVLQVAIQCDATRRWHDVGARAR
jgi:hypothetical protein